MPITGLSFLLFALAAVVLYYLFPKRLRQYVLLAASILFYLTYGVRMAGYLAATILLTYLFGLWLDRLAAFRPAAETKEERKRQKRDEENTRADSQYENNDVFRLHKFFLLDSFGLDTASALQRESEGKGAPSSRPDFFVPFRALHDG